MSSGHEIDRRTFMKVSGGLAARLASLAPAEVRETESPFLVS
jgi:hypothetical protein